MPREIPQELVDQIIAYHDTDLTQLRIFTLVSYPWLVVARRHLFRTIFVTASYRYGKGMDPAEFPSLLKTGGPTVCLAVQHLRFGRSVGADVELPVVVEALHRFSNLKTLAINNRISETPLTVTLPSPLCICLNKLNLSKCSVSRGTFLEVISLFESIMDLRLIEMSIRDDSASPKRSFPARNRRAKTGVRSLAFWKNTDARLSEFVAGLLAVVDVESIELMDLGSMSLTSEVHSPLLNAVSQSLKGLTVRLTDVNSWNFSGIGRTFDPATHPHLLTLRLVFPLGFSSELPFAGFQILASPSLYTALTHLTVELLHHHYVQVDRRLLSLLQDQMWVSVAASLRGLPVLKTLLFRVRHNLIDLENWTVPPSVQEALREVLGLPSCTFMFESVYGGHGS